MLNHIEGDRYAAAWHLALSGLRRGEIAALRWSDIDLNSGTIAITRNRLRFGDKVVEGTVKSKASDRKLPLPDNLAATLKAAKTVQAAAAESTCADIAVGTHARRGGPSARPLHDARHTCGTLMHLEGVPIAVIAAWLGHASSAFTMATCVHSQEPALADAARRLARVVTNS